MVSSNMLDQFLQLLPDNLDGQTEEMQLASLVVVILKLVKQLTKVRELHQLVENPAALQAPHLLLVLSQCSLSAHGVLSDCSIALSFLSDLA